MRRSRRRRATREQCRRLLSETLRALIDEEEEHIDGRPPNTPSAHNSRQTKQEKKEKEEQKEEEAEEQDDAHAACVRSSKMAGTTPESTESTESADSSSSSGGRRPLRWRRPGVREKAVLAAADGGSWRRSAFDPRAIAALLLCFCWLVGTLEYGYLQWATHDYLFAAADAELTSLAALSQSFLALPAATTPATATAAAADHVDPRETGDPAAILPGGSPAGDARLGSTPAGDVLPGAPDTTFSGDDLPGDPDTILLLGVRTPADDTPANDTPADDTDAVVRTLSSDHLPATELDTKNEVITKKDANPTTRNAVPSSTGPRSKAAPARDALTWTTLSTFALLFQLNLGVGTLLARGGSLVAFLCNQHRLWRQSGGTSEDPPAPTAAHARYLFGLQHSDLWHLLHDRLFHLTRYAAASRSFLCTVPCGPPEQQSPSSIPSHALWPWPYLLKRLFLLLALLTLGVLLSSAVVRLVLFRGLFVELLGVPLLSPASPWFLLYVFGSLIADSVTCHVLVGLFRAYEEFGHCAVVVDHAEVSAVLRASSHRRSQQLPDAGSVCRICHGTIDLSLPPLTAQAASLLRSPPSDEVWLRPCLCRGSIAFAHERCLSLWRTASVSSPNLFACSVCHARYCIVPIGQQCYDSTCPSSEDSLTSSSSESSTATCFSSSSSTSSLSSSSSSTSSSTSPSPSSNSLSSKTAAAFVLPETPLERERLRVLVRNQLLTLLPEALHAQLFNFLALGPLPLLGHWWALYMLNAYTSAPQRDAVLFFVLDQQARGMIARSVLGLLALFSLSLALVDIVVLEYRHYRRRQLLRLLHVGLEQQPADRAEPHERRAVDAPGVDLPAGANEPGANEPGVDLPAEMGLEQMLDELDDQNVAHGLLLALFEDEQFARLRGYRVGDEPLVRSVGRYVLGRLLLGAWVIALALLLGVVLRAGVHCLLHENGWELVMLPSPWTGGNSSPLLDLMDMPAVSQQHVVTVLLPLVLAWLQITLSCTMDMLLFSVLRYILDKCTARMYA